MSISAQQKKNYNMKIATWLTENFSGKDFTTDEVFDALNSDENKIAFPKIKKAKDTNAPKKPLSGYMLYTASIREEIVNDNPDLKMTELSKIFGMQWRTLSSDEKEPFMDQAVENKEKYTKEMEEYSQSSDEDVEVEKKTEKKTPSINILIKKQYPEEVLKIQIENAIDGKNQHWMTSVKQFKETLSEEQLGDLVK